MSILIKGIDMPQAGHWTTICIYNGGMGAEPNWQGVGSNMQSGEAVPVPPHGRLIDADAMIEEINEAMADAQENARTPAQKKLLAEVSIGFIHDLQDASTVIEAEEGE